MKWGEFSFGSLFNKIAQGRRLKKNDQIPGDLPFVMSGFTNTGVVNYVSNPIERFPANSITVDIFGNTFYRDYAFGAGDDTGIYWNSDKNYSKSVMLFLAAAMGKSLEGQFDYGKKLRSSQSLNLKTRLPVKDGEPDYDFMEQFVTDFMEQFVTDLEYERITKLEGYLAVAGLKDYTLTAEEQKALDDYHNLVFDEFNVIDIFTVRNTRNILSRNIVENSGSTPYLCASGEDNGVSSYIDYNNAFLEEGNCIFIGGKTFVVTYQDKDFFSNDSHNLALYLNRSDKRTRLNQLYLVACVNKSLGHQYSWGDSISHKKIRKDKVMLPANGTQPDYEHMAVFISAIQKLVIKDVVLFAERNIAAHQAVTKAT
ncbi:restriction endonuclease subunit S [Acidithiobacillus thiooxidans]|uniref:restriction endonuclease subunit S n=1 Tax=Acidithiobacillus thiooxidans TaxID=930 RepID=UPI0029C0015F|nr:restriction endonuclease subunit S [Acidithiobacillus thiooxidans]